MRTLHGFATVCLFTAALAALLPACSSTTDSGGGGGGSPGAAGSTSTGGSSSTGTGDAAKGATLYGSQCASCHGPDAAGNQGPNITLSMTAGIGSWTYPQFHDAVRSAKGKDGMPLCQFMSAFTDKDVSESGMQDLYAFLKSKPINDTVNKGTYCP